MSSRVSGTEGYADEAEELFNLYESFSAADAHRAVLHLIPTEPSRILDIGSGTGRDAAWFASQGHRVVAVEPTDALRIPAMALHPSQEQAIAHVSAQARARTGTGIEQQLSISTRTPGAR